MNKKLSENMLFNVISQIVGIIVPLITGPYIARVFTAEIIGRYSFANANASYFILLGALGLGQHGMLQTAMKRSNKSDLSQLFWEIFFLKVILNAISVCIYFALFFTNNSAVDRVLYGILLLNILANMLDISWFLNGLEEFKAMALRNSTMRGVSVILILLFVHSTEDFYIYAVLMQLPSLIVSSSLFTLLRDRITWTGFSSLNLRKHLKPSMVYFVPGIVHVVFTAVDKTMLGIQINEYEVGIYEQAYKISSLCAGILNSVSNVLLARAMFLFHNEGEGDGASKLMQLTLRVGGLLILPVTLGVAAVSDTFVEIFFGAGYEKSGQVLQVLSLQVLFSTLANYYSHQCMIARGRQKEYNIAIIISSVANVILNYLLIPHLASIGAAITSAVSGMITMFILLYYGKDTLSFTQLWKLLKNYCFAAMSMYVCVTVLPAFDSLLLTAFIQVMVGIMVYMITVVLLKDEFAKDLLAQGMAMIKKK